MYGRLAWDEAKKSVHYYNDDLDQVFILKISEHHWAPRSEDRNWFTALPDATYSHLQNETGRIGILNTLEFLSTKTCKGKHGLTPFLAPEAGCGCKVCGKVLQAGDFILGCRTCNIDVCEACALKAVS